MKWRIPFFAVCGAIAGAVCLFAYVDYQREPVWHPQAPQWSGGQPVTVGWDPQSFGDFSTQLRQAIDLINDEVGCPVLSPSGTAGQITLLTGFERDHCPGTPLGPKDTAATYYCGGGTVDIHVQRLTDITTALQVFRHELGHGLGLAHDPSGLMAPRLVVTTPLEGLSRKDRRAIADRMCP